METAAALLGANVGDAAGWRGGGGVSGVRVEWRKHRDRSGGEGVVGDAAGFADR